VRLTSVLPVLPSVVCANDRVCCTYRGYVTDDVSPRSGGTTQLQILPFVGMLESRTTRPRTTCCAKRRRAASGSTALSHAARELGDVSPPRAAQARCTSHARPKLILKSSRAHRSTPRRTGSRACRCSPSRRPRCASASSAAALASRGRRRRGGACVEGPSAKERIHKRPPTSSLL
jgi:hypothetical protein